MSKARRVKNQAALVKELGLSKATVSKYVADGLSPEPDGTFDVEKAQEWHKKAVKQMKAGTSRTPAWKRAHERRLSAQADMAEDKRDLSRGELVSRTEVKKQWTMQLLQIRDSFLYLGREVAPQLVGLSVREIQAAIDNRVQQILRVLSSEPKKA